MLINFIGSVWRHLPGAIRRRVVRLGQRRFTVTVGAMIFDDANRILLLEHVFRPDSVWGIPGGFMNHGEQPEAALRRELREEIGVDIEQAEFLFVRTLRRPRQVEIYFRAHINGEPRVSSFEIKRAEWFRADELPAELSRDQQKLIQQTVRLSEKS